MKNELLAEMTALREKIENNDRLFDLVDDPDIAEALIFERKALAVRLSHVIAKAKDCCAEYAGKGEAKC